MSKHSITFPNLTIDQLEKKIKTYCRQSLITLKDTKDGLELSWSSPILNYKVDETETKLEFNIWIKGATTFLGIDLDENKNTKIKLYRTVAKLR